MSEMDYTCCDCDALPASVSVSCFRGASGVAEYHVTVRPTEYGSFEEQLAWVCRAYGNRLESLGLDFESGVFRRFFCSDLVNQAASLEARPFSNPSNADDPCAVSWVCQPPVPPVKVALWAYHINDPEGKLSKSIDGTSVTLQRDGLAHHWTTQFTCTDAESSYGQTFGVFRDYEAFLEPRGLSLADNVIRTWFFVQNVDANYEGLVVARREHFAERGLTADTHYIASTGIEGSSSNVAGKVLMDAYAVSGIQPAQIEFIEALDNLSPTHVYGVTFERATSVAYEDRKHIFISGTASIDKEGNILHLGDVSRQLDRTLENVEALLKQAGASLDDMAVFTVYVRDPSDHDVVWKKMRDRFGHVPMEVVVAPVCRPGWLVEIEGVAIAAGANPSLPAF